jgi:hypothetical protein
MEQGYGNVHFDTNIYLTEGMESGSGIHCFISIVFCRKVLCNKLLLLLLFVWSELLVGTCSEPMLLILLLPELLILSVVVVVVVVKEVVVATDSTPSLEQLGVVPAV